MTPELRPEVTMPKCEIEIKPVTFEAAHLLPQFCSRMHGHTYRLTIRIAGPLKDGAIADWWAVRAIAKSAVATLDHRNLNDVVKNPTGEMVAFYLWTKISTEVEEAYPGCSLTWLRLCEGDNAVELTPGPLEMIT